MHSQFFYVKIRDAAGKVLDEIETEVVYRLSDGEVLPLKILKEDAQCWPIAETVFLGTIGTEALSQLDEPESSDWRERAVMYAREDEASWVAEHRREDRAERYAGEVL